MGGAHRIQNIMRITTLAFRAGGCIATVLLESFLGNAGISWAWGEVELLATQLLGTNDVADIHYIIFGFDEGVQYFDKNRTLSDCGLRTSITVSGVVRAKALLKRRVDMILKNAGQIDGVFFEIVKQTNGVQKGGVVDLHGKYHRLAVIGDVALPDMVEYVVGFDRIAWNEDHE